MAKVRGGILWGILLTTLIGLVIKDPATGEAIYVITHTSGDYCGGVPPHPIPNREVKPACADGTAMQCGRVGGRHFSEERPFHQYW